MSSLTELREKVERASGPDRELDLLIGLTIDGWQLGELAGGLAHGKFLPTLGGTLVRDSSGDVNVAVPGGMYPAPTESIDAALALVERKLPGQQWSILCYAMYERRVKMGKIITSDLALAIIAQMLRALESQEQAGG